MASERASQSGQIFTAVLRFLRIFTLNTWRRLLIWGRYTIICLHQQRFRRACRILGQRVLLSLEGGEVNPMLAGEVKDGLAKAQAVKRAKDRHYQAIAALRDKIRAAKAGEAPSPPPEAEPSSAPEAGQATPGPEERQEKGQV